MRLPIRSWRKTWGSLGPLFSSTLFAGTLLGGPLSPFAPRKNASPCFSRRKNALSPSERRLSRDRRRSRKRRLAHRGRVSHLQQLEERQLLTGTLQLLDGSTQLSNGGSDSFGSVAQGATDTKTFTVKNVGADTLTVNSLSLPNAFSTSTSFPLSVAAGQSATFSVSLYTGGTGQFSGAMVLQDSDTANSPFNVNLSGMVTSGGSPSMTLRDGSTVLTGGSTDSFGTVSAGTTDNKIFSVSNSGSATLTVSNISVPTGFTLGTTLPLNVPPGQSGTFVVDMNTSSAASFNGQMSVSSNDPMNSSLIVGLSGTVTGAAAPSMQVLDGQTALANGANDSFGTVNVGGSDSKTFSIENTGSASLTVSAVTPPSGYTLQTAVPLTVPAGGSTGLTIALTTTTAGSFSGPLTITDNDPANNPFTINVSGTVTTPPAPVLQLLDGSTTLTSGSTDSFGSVLVGATDTKTYTLENTGNAVLSISGLSLPGGFSLQGTAPSSVAAGGSTTFTVTMDTSTARGLSGTMSIGSNDSHSPLQITLSGTVNLPPPVISVLDGATTLANGTGSDSFGTTLVGVPVQKTFTIANSGGSAIAITAGSLQLPSGFSLQGAFPASVPAGGSATFIVQMDATAAGNQQGFLSFSDGDPGASTYRFTITGLVTAPSLNVLDSTLEGGTLLPSGTTDDFGTATLGVPVVKTFTLMNSGNGQLYLAPTSLLLPAGFSLVGSFPSTVAAGGSATFQLQLDAKTDGSFGGALSFTDSDPAHSPYLLNLTGQVNAAAGAIQVVQDLLDNTLPVIDGGSDIAFGSTNAGTPLTQTFNIKNTGQAALTLDASTLIVPAGFSVLTPFDTSVAPGGSTNLVIQLDATQGGDYSGPVSFDTSDPNHGTFSFLVNGHVNPAAAAIAVYDGSTPVNAGSGYDSFGTATLGAPITKTFVIDNTGTAILTLTPNSLSLPAGFSLVTPFAASVPVGGSTTLAIELTAAAGGNYSGQVSFVDSAPNQNPFTFFVSGMVNAPAMSVTNSGTALTNGGTVDFGNTPLGTPVTRTLVILNTGAAALTLDPTSLSLPASYSLVSGFASTVAPGGSTSLTVQLDAVAPGLTNGQITFRDGDPNNSPFSFTVTGAVNAAAIKVLDGAAVLVSGSGDDFGNTTIGAALQKTLTIDNAGQAPLTLSASSIVTPTGFSVVTPFANTVAAGGSTTLVVQLDAKAAASDSGLLTFTTNDPLVPVYELHVSGKVPAPTLEVVQSGNVLASGSSVALGTTTIGSPVDLTLMIDNGGTGALTLNPASLTLPAGFSAVTPLPSSVAADSGTAMTIALTASAAGSYSGTFSFDSNDPSQPVYQLSLSGVVNAPANAPVLTVSDGASTLANGASTVVFPQAVVGSPTTQTLTITNNGTAPLTLDASSLTLPSGYSVVTPFAGTVAAGTSTSLVLQLNAAAAGTYTGALSFTSNDTAHSPFSVSLSGAVFAPSNLSVASVASDGERAPLTSGGTLAFGTAALNGLPVYKVLELKNIGTSALTFDPTSVVLPTGFSVFQMFGSSVAAGGETTLTLAMSTSAAGSLSGPASFHYNDGSPETFSFNVSGTVSAPSPAGISLDQVVLANNIGPRAAETTADPTITGLVDGTFNGGSVVVQFDTNNDSVSDGQTAAVTKSGGSFTFDPRSVDSALNGFVGTVDLHYRAEVLDAAGNATYGTWTNFAFTMVAAPTSAHIDDLQLANDTGASSSELLTYDPRVTARVGGPFVGTTVSAQFVVGDGAGNPAGSLPASPTITGAATGISSPGQTFTYNAANDDPALVNYAGTVNLSYRTVEYDVNGNVVQTGAWSTFSFTLYVPTPQASVSGLQLVDDTGSSNTDQITSDPTVSGTVTGTFTNEIVEVQFSNRGNGTVDGMAAVAAVGENFTYDPRQTEPTLDAYSGALNLSYRTVELDAHGGQVISPWTAFPMTLVEGTTTAVIDNLALTDVTGAAGPPPTTDDPTIGGLVAGMQESGSPQVQIAYNGDGLPDQTVTAKSDGTFSDALSGLPYGSVTVSARAVEFDSTEGAYLYGAWSTLSFNYVPPPPPNILSLGLADVTDTATGGTSDPTIKGSEAGGQGSGSGTTSSADGELTEIQFDTNGDSTPDGTTLADMQGNFSFTPVGLAYGSVTIAARAVGHGAGPLTFSPWFKLTFTYEAPPAQAPSISGFQLANSNGAPSATDPTVMGTVVYPALVAQPPSAVGSGAPSLSDMPQSADFLTVQFDYNGDSTPDASTTTGPGGTFVYTPQGLAAGSVTIRARAVGRDSQQNKIYGEWTSLSFTYAKPATNVPSVSALTLANPLPPVAGASPTAPPTATDPTVTGQLAALADTSPLATAFVTVEIDTNNDGTPDATVQADANGNFSYTPTGLALGTVTIQARARQHDYTTGGYDYSAWTPLTFTYQ
ncbi:MAG TPA: choice-of-anchor D domain-containing protein, partial [Pirellulales bacterium]|nr:choice-of-anchor D domain-containing protein [Pirellulales bacterium]